MIELTTDINLLMKYWQLQNIETLMAETYFGPYNWIWDDHNNFRFTPIPNKTNDLIFLKKFESPIFVPFVAIFGNFCLMGIFSQKSSLNTSGPYWTLISAPPRESNKRDHKKKSQMKHSLPTLNTARAVCWK